jgi:hypothetical protein
MLHLQTTLEIPWAGIVLANSDLRLSRGGHGFQAVVELVVLLVVGGESCSINPEWLVVGRFEGPSEVVWTAGGHVRCLENVLLVFRTLEGLCLVVLYLEFRSFEGLQIGSVNLDWHVLSSLLDFSCPCAIFEMQAVGFNSTLQVNNLLLEILDFSLVNLILLHQFQALLLLVSKLVFDLRHLGFWDLWFGYNLDSWLQILNLHVQVLGSGFNDIVALCFFSFDDLLKLDNLHRHTFILSPTLGHECLLCLHLGSEADFLILVFKDLFVQLLQLELVAGTDALADIHWLERTLCLQSLELWSELLNVSLHGLNIALIRANLALKLQELSFTLLDAHTEVIDLHLVLRNSLLMLSFKLGYHLLVHLVTLHHNFLFSWLELGVEVRILLDVDLQIFHLLLVSTLQLSKFFLMLLVKLGSIFTPVLFLVNDNDFFWMVCDVALDLSRNTFIFLFEICNSGSECLDQLSVSLLLFNELTSRLITVSHNNAWVLFLLPD